MRADIVYLSTDQLADNWRLSAWTVRELARKGRIRGAEKPGRDWRFPSDASLDAPAPEPSYERHTREQALAAIQRLR